MFTNNIATVSEKLPVAVILGEDIPQLIELLGETEELKEQGAYLQRATNKNRRYLLR